MNRTIGPVVTRNEVEARIKTVSVNNTPPVTLTKAMKEDQISLHKTSKEDYVNSKLKVVNKAPMINYLVCKGSPSGTQKTGKVCL